MSIMLTVLSYSNTQVCRIDGIIAHASHFTRVVLVAITRSTYRQYVKRRRGNLILLAKQHQQSDLGTPQSNLRGRIFIRSIHPTYLKQYTLHNTVADPVIQCLTPLLQIGVPIVSRTFSRSRGQSVSNLLASCRLNLILISPRIDFVLVTKHHDGMYHFPFLYCSLYSKILGRRSNV